MPMHKKAERIQKVLARIGLGSRRQIESWVYASRITINGKVAQPGDLITSKDIIYLDNKLIKRSSKNNSKTKVLIYHKPVGDICTRKDTKGRPTVFDNLPPLQGQRWISVGRLDINTSGLLLFTNNGELANRLMHPSSGIDREYAVRVIGKVNEQMLQKMQHGVRLGNSTGRFTDIVDAGGKGANHWYYVTLMQGRNHEVKRIWESHGLTVSRLIRVRFGPIILPRWLRPWAINELDDKTLRGLYQWLDEPKSIKRV